MASQVPAKKNTQYLLDFAIFFGGDIKASPTIVAGDVQIKKDGGSYANVTNLPTADAQGEGVLTLTATEMNADRQVVRFRDQTVSREWDMVRYHLSTAAQTHDETKTAVDARATPAQVATELGTYDGPTRAEATADKDAIITQGDSAWATATGFPTKAEMDAAHALLATPAQVNAQVLDVMNVDTLVAGVTISESLRRIGAVTSYKLSDAGTGTETVTDWADSINTIVFTVDASGNKSAVTFN